MEVAGLGTQHVGNQSRYTEGAAKSILLAESLRSKELKSGSAQTAHSDYEPA
jgi:hypothetical protein